MNILVYTNCLVDPKLGSGKTVLMFSQGMRNRGHTIEVNAPEDYETWHGMRKGMKFRQAWGSWLSVRRELKAKQYNIIEFYGDEFWLAIRHVSKSKRRPLIVARPNLLWPLELERMRVHDDHSWSVGNVLSRWFFRHTHERFSHMAYANADACVTLCEEDRQYVLRKGFYPAERTAVVAPGLDEEYLSVPFLPMREERVAFTGSWILRKGVDKVARVMTNLLTRYPALHFDVYGTWWARDPVLKSFPPQVHAQITVYPELSNGEMAEALARAKVFFFPSQYESFGIALAEAMACGCAAVTTPTGFGAELQSMKEALLCDFNDLERMEQSISQLLKDNELRQDIACEGWKRARSLRWDASVNKLEDIYSDWIENRRSAIA